MSREESVRTVQVTKPSLEAERAHERRPQRFSLLVYHREGAHIVPLQPSIPVVVGRAAPSDVTINDANLSRQHARFTLLEEGRLAVEDLGSTNGTQISGVPIDRVELDPAGEVTLGGVTATFHALAFDQAPPSSKDLAGHERFRAAIESEVRRARFFGRSLSVIWIRALEPKASHVRFWTLPVQGAVRPVDCVGLYSDDSVLILMPEAGLKESEELANTLVTTLANAKPTPAKVICGIATFPDHAAHTEELLSEARAAAQRASADKPVSIASDQQRRTFTRAEGAPDDPPIVAASMAMKQLLKTASRVARGALPVLLCGETGTGKEVLSRYLHDESPRRAKPLVCVNCAAIPSQLIESMLFGHERGSFTGASASHKGVFESADGGTVFLDEIGELPAPAQAALLRVLETKRFARVGATKEITVDVRVIAATHRDLERMVEDGGFRQDLLFRLNTITLNIPPLRDRVDDIPMLAARFLEQANEASAARVRAIDVPALESMKSYAWPGNVRELKNAIERAVAIAHGDTVTVDDLPERVSAASLNPPPAPKFDSGEIPVAPRSPLALDGDFRSRMEKLECEVLTAALKEANWSQTETAKQLSMPLRTLVYKIRVHGIRRPNANPAKTAEKEKRR